MFNLADIVFDAADVIANCSKVFKEEVFDVFSHSVDNRIADMVLKSVAFFEQKDKKAVQSGFPPGIRQPQTGGALEGHSRLIRAFFSHLICIDAPRKRRGHPKT